MLKINGLNHISLDEEEIADGRVLWQMVKELELYSDRGTLTAHKNGIIYKGKERELTFETINRLSLKRPIFPKFWSAIAFLIAFLLLPVTSLIGGLGLWHGLIAPLWASLLSGGAIFYIGLLLAESLIPWIIIEGKDANGDSILAGFSDRRYLGLTSLFGSNRRNYKRIRFELGLLQK